MNVENQGYKCIKSGDKCIKSGDECVLFEGMYGWM